MAGPRLDPQVVAHLEWIGFVQPTGLVVSAPALVRAGAILDRRDAEGQRLLREKTHQREFDRKIGPEPWLPDFETFARSVLEWSFSSKGYAGTAEAPIPSELEVVLPDYGETLRPDYAVREMEPVEGKSPWQLLVKKLSDDQEFDRIASDSRRLEASPHGRMERLLRRTGVSAGLLFNGRAIRLVAAPHGESSGWIDFRVADMVRTDGRAICTALRLLLSQTRLLSLPRQQRLAALLEDSRKFQNEVSERLAEQVLHALYELLRGFQGAHDASKGELLRQALAENPDDVYRALLTVILRLVFLLYAEERDMLPEDDTFIRNYSLAGLYERLREDAALYPDTMEQRHSGWAQLLVLFRMIHDGAEAGVMRLPKRHGVLFDPDRFSFLEGRVLGVARQVHERIDAPLVSDGTIYRVLDKLLVLDGERISYRALDVEQIGSVYETMMGFRLETAAGPTVAIKAPKKYGAPTAVNLQALLDQPAGQREKWLHERTDRKPGEAAKKALAAARSIADLHAALLPIIDLSATPDLVPIGAMVPQPSDERRRSGTDYTPRALTEPIVREALAPIFDRLRDSQDRAPLPEQILELKVLDPAMGSGAFLVEACRQLADALVESWHAHNALPSIPPDEDEVIFARRLVAQRCLYGVDRNLMAADLAKVSLWLATLAKDHALTFVDHALRHGDSLVGLSRKQIEAFQWDVSGAILRGMNVREPLDKVAELRRRIREADESVSDWERRDLWDEAQLELGRVRLIGDLAIAAFFEAENPKQREAKRVEYAQAVANGKVERYRSGLAEQRSTDYPLVSFHWEVEFPEVFDRDNSGFDAIVGNPPFAGKNSVAAANPASYPDWLKQIHPESHGNADLVAHFYRRAFDLMRREGTFGLIATNTIAQGDTRATGLRWICQHGGEIYRATKRVKWPGRAAVVVSVVHVIKGSFNGIRILDNDQVEKITAFLFHTGGHGDPAQLRANADKSFQGSVVLGIGFTFDDTDSDGVAASLGEMRRLIAKDPGNQEVIFPYIGGQEVNTSPTHAHHRYVIDFFDRSETDCRRRWPDLMEIVERKVKPERDVQDRKALRERWWQYAEKRPGLYRAIAGLDRVLVCPGGTAASKYLSFAFLPGGMVYSQTLCVFPFLTYAAFCALQSRPHEIWARFFGASLEDRPRYNSSDCFETFPFPDCWDTHPALEAAGLACYDFRAALMLKRGDGLTQTYNRFHDPDMEDAEILKLRELHARMDRAVLDAYGWRDIDTRCEFLLDYEIDDEEWGERKKPYRYRWPDSVREEVLARLLELNTERAKSEALVGAVAKTAGGKGRAKNKARAVGGLF